MALSFAEIEYTEIGYAPEPCYTAPSASEESPYRYMFSDGYIILLNKSKGIVVSVKCTGFINEFHPFADFTSLFSPESEYIPDFSSYNKISTLTLPHTDKVFVLCLDDDMYLAELDDNGKFLRLGQIDNEHVFETGNILELFARLTGNEKISTMKSYFVPDENAIGIIGGTDGPTSVFVTGGGNAASVGIIDGADGPTSVFIKPSEEDQP